MVRFAGMANEIGEISDIDSAEGLPQFGDKVIGDERDIEKHAQQRDRC